MPLNQLLTRLQLKTLAPTLTSSSTHGTYPEESLQKALLNDSLDRIRLLTSEDRSPSKNQLRGMLIRRAMEGKPRKPKRVKLSRTKNTANRKLLEQLGSLFSESEISMSSSSHSSNMW
nr:ORF3 [Torque teno felis virus]QYD01836.1 ORF3 [Torque teno felis virus]QYD01842.1 ORF3 [Torque teno felis virus]QYD01872.1 ORF3 [Torque teno felis virus]QYD01893.1 ORF3 [Torque teno felis virus]